MNRHCASYRNRRFARRRGAGLIIALVTLLVITLLTAAVVRSLVIRLRQSRIVAAELQAAWVADAAMARAVAQLHADPEYDGETWRAVTAASDDAEHTGIAEVRVVRSSNTNYRLKVEARFPDDPVRRVVASRTMEITTQKPESNAGSSPQETAP
jgi:Tfp pilus assembly protein PilX